MNDQTDSQLLGSWAETRSEPAFAELVRRHVDFVYSAAVRMVCDSHLAKDVTQTVFVALAKDAARIADHRVLSGWLHRTAQNVAAQTVRTDVRRRAREQEAAIMNPLLATEVEAPWEHIAPHLDAALGELSELDRDAVLLRYFENKSLREVGQALGTSDDTAQKRVSRAVERLREFFAKRGTTVGASGLVVVISANAVQAAPAGLAITISAAAALAGTTIATTATTSATATKAIAMTTIQKAIIGAVLAAAVGTGIYEVRQGSILLTQVEDLQQQRAPLAAQVEQLTLERDEATNRLALLGGESEKLRHDSVDVLKLRAQTARMRGDSEELERRKWMSANAPYNTSDPDWKPNWGALRSVDLLQYADSTNIVTRDSATNVGTATPTALLQTWLWALRTGDTEGLLKTIEFPEGTTDAKKLEFVSGVQSRKPPDADQFQNYSLRELLSLGGDRYLALIGEWRSTPADAWVGHKILYRVGGEWKIR